jgi:hypothetical protein
MKRAAAVFALVATVIVAAWLAASVSAQRTRTTGPRYEWPMGLGALDEVPKRYPARDTSNDAARLTALAAAAGVDLSPPPARSREDRQWLSRYVDVQLTRADLGADPPPPELVQYLAANETALSEVRAYLLTRTAIIWPTDIGARAQAPLPNLFGHLTLTRLFIAHALTSPQTASDDLRAAWHLQRALWHRPELISKQVALAGTRFVNAAARRLDARPAWFDEIRAIDYRRSMLAGQQSEAWAIRNSSEPDAQDIADVVVQPYLEICAANLTAVMRRAASDIAQSRDCAIDGRALDRRMHAMIPLWNHPGRSQARNLGSAWQRVGRFQAELEATERIFAIKSGTWTADLDRSVCADGSWAYADGTLRFSREIPAPRPMLNVPLAYRSAAAEPLLSKRR